MSEDTAKDPAGSRGRVLTVISLATTLTLSIWFRTTAIGLALGTLAKLRLRSLPESRKLAAGLR